MLAVRNNFVVRAQIAWHHVPTWLLLLLTVDLTLAVATVLTFAITRS